MWQILSFALLWGAMALRIALYYQSVGGFRYYVQYQITLYRRRRSSGGSGFNIGAVVQLVISISMIPILMAVFNSLSLEGTAGDIITLIVPLLPIILVMKALEKLGIF